MAINSMASYNQYDNLQELDYTSDPKYVSTEGCFACNMNNGNSQWVPFEFGELFPSSPG